MGKPSGSDVRYSFFMFLAGCFLFTSCQTYRYGYWGKFDNPENGCYSSPDSVKTMLGTLAQKKRDLNAAAFSLSEEMITDLNDSKPIPARTFNLLFANLHDQYQVDTLYHRLFQQAPNDSVRRQSKQALLESALNYKMIFQRSKFIRRTINRGEPAYGIPANTLTQTQQFLWSDRHNRRYLVEHEKDPKAVRTKVGFILSKGVDKWNAGQYKTVFYLSMLFGRLVGPFHGRIDKKTNAMLLKSHLQEFDIVLLKSLTHLTERFIPGYFGHVGICLGNDLMIEAPRSGVRVCSTEDFAEGEIYLVIRPVNLTEKQKQDIRILLRKQLGKEYDFNFDTQSPDRVVCSELVSLSYDFVDWQTKKIAGRYTTSPDDLIRSLIHRPDFSIEMYLNKGQFVDKPDAAFVQELLKMK